jgi:hypothetical protein
VLFAGGSGWGAVCVPVGVEAWASTFAGGGGGGGGLGLLRSCWTAEGAEGSSSDPELWASRIAPKSMLPSNKIMPRNVMRPQLYPFLV